jgi:transcriptional regulator with XRE-family HTH domain
MDDKQDFAQRLQAAMQAAGYAPRPAVLEREFNPRYWGRSVTLQAVRRWLRGEALPSQDKLQVLAEWLKVEPHELRFGTRVARSVQAYHERWDEKLNPVHREALDAFLPLPAAQRRLIREVILTFARVHAQETAPDPVAAPE